MRRGGILPSLERKNNETPLGIHIHAGLRVAMDESSSSPEPSRRPDGPLRRARVIGFAGAGVAFFVSQVGLLWVLATGGIGSTPSVAATIWLFSTLVSVLFMLLLADSYRQSPRWLAPAAGNPSVGGEPRSGPDGAPAKLS